MGSAPLSCLGMQRGPTAGQEPHKLRKWVRLPPLPPKLEAIMEWVLKVCFAVWLAVAIGYPVVATIKHYRKGRGK